MKCIKCGTEMNSTTGGSYICYKCGLKFNDLVYRSRDYEVAPHQSFVKRGWVCPVCGRGVAPWMSFCPCQSDLKSTQGTGTGTDTYTNLNSEQFGKYETVKLCSAKDQSSSGW